MEQSCKIVIIWWERNSILLQHKKNYSYIKIKTSKEAFDEKCTRPSLDARLSLI